jgi:hypothetical protein
MKGVHYSEPFILVMYEGNLNGEMDENDLSMVVPRTDEATAIASMCESVRDHGGAEQLYMCIPIGRVWAADFNQDDDSEGPYEDIRVDIAETQLERMARAAAAMGGK